MLSHDLVFSQDTSTIAVRLHFHLPLSPSCSANAHLVVPYSGVYILIHTDLSAPPSAPLPDHYLVLHAQVSSLVSHSVTLDQSFPALRLGRTISFSYAVYALGSKLPAPIDLWAHESVENSVVAQPGAASPEERRRL